MGLVFRARRSGFPGLGFRVRDFWGFAVRGFRGSGFRVQDFTVRGFRGLQFRVCILGFLFLRVRVSRFGVSCSGFQFLDFTIRGLWFRVRGFRCFAFGVPGFPGFAFGVSR